MSAAIAWLDGSDGEGIEDMPSDKASVAAMKREEEGKRFSEQKAKGYHVSCSLACLPRGIRLGLNWEYVEA